ncbi:MAG: T9SS type A sorting domain-containing protein [Bacteroidales bacterium]|nr:T9SS type A sorting domain-containing protein [Bacteroidales bacterium]
MKKYTYIFLLALMAIMSKLDVFAQTAPSQSESDGFYELSSYEELLWFAQQVNEGKVNLNARLVNSIDFTSDDELTPIMIGTSEHRYAGEFDGNRFTIEIDYKSSTSYTALFAYINGAKIHDLKVAGYITTSDPYVAGVVANAIGAFEIRNVISNVKIETNVGAGAYAAGIVAHCADANKTAYLLSDCGFKGNIKGNGSTTYVAGIIADAGGASYTGAVLNCFATAEYRECSTTNSLVNNGEYVRYSNCYYKNTLTDKQGDVFTNVSDGRVAFLLNGAKNEGVWNKILEFRSEGLSEDLGEELVANGEGVYEIGTAYDFLKFAAMVNTGRVDIKGKLTKDIDISSYQTMIGNYTYRYKGEFDGDGHSVTVNYENGIRLTGLFYYTAEGFYVHDLTVKGNIQTTQEYAAGIIGYCAGSARLERCISKVNIQTSRHYSGGLIGYIDAGQVEIKECAYIGTITRKANSLVTGGFVGNPHSRVVTISNSYVAATYSGGSAHSNAGSFSGTNSKGITTVDSYYLNSPGSNATNNLGEKKSAEEFENGTVCKLLNFGKTEETAIWFQNLEGEVDVYPVLDRAHTAHISDIETLEPDGEGYYLINNAADLALFAKMVNAGESGINGRVTADIDFKDDQDNYYQNMIGTSVNPYAGVFDGGRHIITLGYNTKSAYAALFSFVSSATIKDLNLAGSITTNTNYCASFVGQNLTAPVTLERCVSSVDIISTLDGEMYTAGLIASPTVSNCVIRNCAFVGSIKNDRTKSTGASGLIGYGNNKIVLASNCYACPRITVAGHSNAAVSPTGCSLFRYTNTDSRIVNCYYSSDFVFPTGQCTKLTSEEVQNGTLCSLLSAGLSDENIVWGQNLGSDNYPIISEENHQAILPLTYNEEENCYEISNANDLLLFSAMVNNGNPALNAKVTEDITYGEGSRFYQEMIGSERYPYEGVFDGNGNTITLGLKSYWSYTAMFGWVSGATIKKLYLDGNITTTKNFAASYVGRNITNPVTIEKCISNVAIESTLNGEIHSGGIIGYSTANLYHITNCAFTGSLTATQPDAKSAAGFVGAGNSKRGFFTNCYSVATYNITGASNCYAFCRSQGTNTVYNNCYYLNPLGTAQGSSKTLEEFKDGTVCQLLNSTVQDGETGVWYQNVEGVTQSEVIDMYPVLDDTHEQPASIEVPKDEYGRYLISTPEHLMKFAGMVNQGMTDITGVLQRDIDFTSYGEMIGSEQYPYEGMFDGKFHKITINYNTVGKYLSLFGYVAGATIKNLIVDGNVKSNSQYASGLVAANTKSPVTLENCMSYVNIESTYASAETRIGGLIGYAVCHYYKISNCAFVGSIKGKNMCGGMVGTSGYIGYFNNCYVFPTSFEMSDTYADCAVFSFSTRQESYFRNCYYDSSLNGSMIKQGNAMTPEDFGNGTVCDALNGFGLSELVWYQNDTDRFPVLLSSHGNLTPPSPAFRNDDNYVFLISTPEELRTFASIVNMGVTRISGRLENDIDYTYQEMIGTEDAPYEGVFDGQFHKITLHLDTRQRYAALFSCVAGSTIMNLIVDGNVTSKGQLIGSIIGYNKDKTAPVTLENCMSYATVTSTYVGADKKSYIGGLAGYMKVADYRFTNCAFAGKLLGDASNSDYSSGLVGHGGSVKGIFTNCYAYVDEYRLSSTDYCASLCLYPAASTIFNNCYYRQRLGLEQGSQMSDEKFLDGSVCYLLNNCPTDESVSVAWYQKVKESEGQVDYDAYPVLIAERGKFIPQDDMEVDQDGTYLLRTPMHLLRFASLVNDGQVSLNAKLMEDIVFGESEGESTSYYQAMIGNATYPYTGSFDGNGKTVTVGYDTQLSYSALFSYVDGANIHDLIVKGSVQTTKNYPASIVGYVLNNPLTMDRCISNVNIVSTYDGNIHAGGLVGLLNVNYSKITNSAFTGSIVAVAPSAALVGGFVGNANGKVIHYNNSFAHATLNITNPAGSASFVRNASKSSVSASLYYLNPFGDMQEAGAEQKTSDEFANGAVCFLLNGSSAEEENVVWYQNVQTDEHPIDFDVYPVLDPTHEIVNMSTLTPEGDTYVIETLEQLKEFANLVNNGQTNINGKLIGDIELEPNSNMMIGTEQNPYVGTFDGQYHSVTVHYNSNNSYVGLFSHVKTATIRNLIVRGDITAGGVYCGAIVGCNNYEVVNDSNIPTPLTMENCISYVDITSTYNGSSETQYGGMIGLIYWVNKGYKLTNCAFLGSITYPAAGKVCGGLIGRANTSGTLTGCYVDATFNVSNTAGSGTMVATSGGVTEFSNCYSSSVLGEPQVVQLTVDQFRDGTATYLLNGCTSDDDNVWKQGADDNDPVFVPSGDTKSCPTQLQPVDGVYELRTSFDIVLFAAMVNAGNNNVDARVMNDIELTDAQGKFYQSMIGNATNPYSGTFDGQYYTITIGYETTSSYTGLFRYAAEATIKNLYLDGKITTNKQYAGSFIGYIKGTTCRLENCISKVDIESRYSSVTDGQHNDEPLYCGGLIGYANATDKYYVENCAFIGTLKEGASSTAQKSQRVAGFVGNGGNRTGVFKSCYTYLPAESVALDIMENSYTFCYGAGQASTYISCYFLTELGILQGDQMSQTDFADGSVCLLLNGSQSQNPIWYQNTEDNILEGELVDSYPVLDNSHHIIKSTELTKVGDYYQIATAQDLVTFASMVNGGQTTIKAQVTADIDFKNTSGKYYQTMIGNSTNMFAGEFDGQYHKITLGYNTTVGYTGLFSVVSGATIQNLIIEGNVTTTKQYTGSIVGRNMTAPMTLRNCMSFANISSSYTSVKEGVHNDALYLGGLVGRIECHYAIVNNCAFAGTIRATGVDVEGKFVGGLVGSGSGKTIRFSNSFVYLPDANLSIDVELAENSATFCYSSGSSTFANCYYLSNLGTVQGAKMSKELFDEGFVCYLLNDGKAEGEVTWYQNTSFSPCDAYPLLTGEEVPYKSEWQMSKDGDYYLIGSTYNLVQFAAMVNSGQNTINGKLISDIDFRQQRSVMIGNSQENAYKGIFDGDLKTIKIDIRVTGSYAGLFQWTSGPTIKNLILEGSVSSTGTYVASFVGVNRSAALRLENSMAIVDVKTSKTGQIRCGGLVGASDRKLTFDNCAYVGSITVPEDATYVGGFVGNASNYDHIVTNSFAYIKNNVASDVDNATFIRTDYTKAKYTNSYYLNALGAIPATGVTQQTEQQFASGDVARLLNMGQENGVWRQKIIGANPDVYPVLYADRETLEDRLTQNEDGFYEIGNADDFLYFVRMVNSGSNDIKVVLTSDIDFRNESGYYQDMIGTSEFPFKGVFDGAGHTITVGFESTSPYAALFSRVGTSTIENVVVKGNISTNSSNASGLIGYNMEGIVTLNNCISDVDITSTYVGESNNAGLVSVITGTGYTISNCAFIGSMTGAEATNCSGLIGTFGDLRGTVENCYVNANIAAQTGSCSIGRNASMTSFLNCYVNNALESNNTDVVVLNSEDFRTGKATYLLNGQSSEDVKWYQKLGSDNNPTFIKVGEDNVVYFAKNFCPTIDHTTTGYANAALQGHHWDKVYNDGILELTCDHKDSQLSKATIVVPVAISDGNPHMVRVEYNDNWTDLELGDLNCTYFRKAKNQEDESELQPTDNFTTDGDIYVKVEFEGQEYEVVYTIAKAIKCVAEGTTGQWNVANNWQNYDNYFGFPTGKHYALIPSGKTVVASSSSTALSVIVEQGATLIIGKPGDTELSTLRIVETLQNEGTIILQGSGTLEVKNIDNRGEIKLYYGYGSDSPSLVYKGSFTGEGADFYRKLRHGAVFYTGSATAEGTITSKDGVYTGIDKEVDVVDCYSKTGNKWMGNIISQFDKFSDDVTAYAVLLRSGSDKGFVQNGTPRAATANRMAITSGWRWFNNPYPYTVSLSDYYETYRADRDGGFLMTGSAGWVSPKIWVRTNNGGTGYGYMTYDVKEKIGVNGETLAPFQDICLAVYSDVPNFALPSTPVPVTHTALKSSKLETDVLRLKVYADGKEKADDEVALAFRASGSMASDIKNLDSKVFGAYTNLSQLVLRKTGYPDQLAIAVYPQVEKLLNVELPLVVKPVSTESKLRITASNALWFDEMVDVFLVDHLAQKTINLREEDYEVSGVAKDSGSRFGIILKAAPEAPEEVITDIKESVVGDEDAEHYIVYSEGSTIVVEIQTKDVLEETMPSIRVYDLLGRVVNAVDKASGRTIIPIRERGVYVVKIGNEARKVIVE